MAGAATIFVRHLDAVAAFYAECFGLVEVAAGPGEYRIVESEAWTLTFVQVPPAVAATITISDPPAPREATPIKLSFAVPSIADARATIVGLGGRVDEREWEFRGSRHCDCNDPEGNVVELREQVDPV
jgi:predicted enzyme related to lactoylglutathione lyase